MRAPTPKRSTNEIVADIMEILDAPAVEALVRRRIKICVQSARRLAVIERSTREG
jgi:hypothetical protein